MFGGTAGARRKAGKKTKRDAAACRGRVRLTAALASQKQRAGRQRPSLFVAREQLAVLGRVAAEPKRVAVAKRVKGRVRGIIKPSFVLAGEFTECSAGQQAMGGRQGREKRRHRKHMRRGGGGGRRDEMKLRVGGEWGLREGSKQRCR